MGFPTLKIGIFILSRGPGSSTFCVTHHHYYYYHHQCYYQHHHHHCYYHYHYYHHCYYQHRHHHCYYHYHYHHHCYHHYHYQQHHCHCYFGLWFIVSHGFNSWNWFTHNLRDYLKWHWSNNTIDPASEKQPWTIWANVWRKSIKKALNILTTSK